MQLGHNGWWQGVLLALALGVVVLMAPGPFALAQEQPRSGGELIMAVPSEPPSYDGHREETFGLIHPIAPFYSLLLRVDPNDYTKVVGDVAERWTVSDDKLILHVHHPQRRDVPRRQPGDGKGCEGELR